MGNFTIQGLVEGCTAAMDASDDRQKAARTYLEKTLAENDPQDMIATLDAAIPKGASIGEMIVHISPALTMLYGRIPPHFRSGIHNHTIFACIGQLAGEEVGVGYERTPDGKGLRKILETRIGPGQVSALPADAIHHIENPGDETASALHVYGGDFKAVESERSLWTFEHVEKPFGFPELLAESAHAMKNEGNQAGLDALVAAIPAVKPLVDSLA